MRAFGGVEPFTTDPARVQLVVKSLESSLQFAYMMHEFDAAIAKAKCVWLPGLSQVVSLNCSAGAGWLRAHDTQVYHLPHPQPSPTIPAALGTAERAASCRRLTAACRPNTHNTQPAAGMASPALLPPSTRRGRSLWAATPTTACTP